MTFVVFSSREKKNIDFKRNLKVFERKSTLLFLLSQQFSSFWNRFVLNPEFLTIRICLRFLGDRLSFATRLFSRRFQSKTCQLSFSSWRNVASTRSFTCWTFLWSSTWELQSSTILHKRISTLSLSKSRRKFVIGPTIYEKISFSSSKTRHRSFCFLIFFVLFFSIVLVTSSCWNWHWNIRKWKSLSEYVD